MEPLQAIEKHFSSLEDPRQLKKCKHELIDIMAISICAVVCGAEGFKEIERYGKMKIEWLQTFLKLENGIPTHHTIGRLFFSICPEKFQACFSNWVNDILERIEGQLIPIDGKTVRRSYDNSSNKSAIHIVNAWASENNALLAQITTEEKSNEVTAIPKLIDLIDIRGCTVSIDAMGCQKNIAEKIIDSGGDYVLALKDNHPNLSMAVEGIFDKLTQSGKVKPMTIESKGHGRLEIRKHYTISDIKSLPGIDDWKGLRSIGMVESERHINGHVSMEKRYYIMSHGDDLTVFAKNTRNHWSIENRLHWVLDVVFKEDESRIRKDHAPENISLIRKMALNMLKKENTEKSGIAIKRKMAGWDNSYLLKVLAA